MKHEDVSELAGEWAARSLKDLDALEEALKLARSIKDDMKRDDVPKEDVEHLRAAWKLCKRKQRIEMPITVVIEVESADSDPCSVYPVIAEPEFMMDWDAYDLIQHNEDVRAKVFEAVKQLQDLLTTANKIHHEFTEQHDVPAESFL